MVKGSVVRLLLGTVAVADNSAFVPVVVMTLTLSRATEGILCCVSAGVARLMERCLPLFCLLLVRSKQPRLKLRHLLLAVVFQEVTLRAVVCRFGNRRDLVLPALVSLVIQGHWHEGLAVTLVHQLPLARRSQQLDLLLEPTLVFRCHHAVLHPFGLVHVSPLLADLLHDFASRPVRIGSLQKVSLFLTVEDVRRKRLLGLLGTGRLSHVGSRVLVGRLGRRVRGRGVIHPLLRCLLIILTQLRGHCRLDRALELGGRGGHLAGFGSDVSGCHHRHASDSDVLRLVLRVQLMVLPVVTGVADVFFLAQIVDVVDELFHLLRVSCRILHSHGSKSCQAIRSLKLPNLADLFHNVEWRDVWHFFSDAHTSLPDKEHVRCQWLLRHLVEQGVVVHLAQRS